MITFKVFLVYLVTGTVVIAGLFAMLMHGEKPHDHIVGTWKETAWHYEELDQMHDHYSVISSEINEQMKHEISQGLVFHQAELWSFYPNGQVVLVNGDGVHRRLDYRLQGRGHVLKLHEEGASPEHYQIKKISEDQMEIHFSTDVKARGLVKVVFEKVPNTISLANEVQ
ncbi:hypothetical protein [Reichenbachiella ulvae]|uniref:Lipocalin-like domain-containing protein n=1 Tax=Reichenbachiella ulvae TaxID=2980104 RepID=A0ABT3CNF8_9BACT|nr:hypothetical protein [Reichenbachiella ulvae]MCV9385058.1 hypothetical protein [Reichenbachiella ulvae]